MPLSSTYKASSSSDDSVTINFLGNIMICILLYEYQAAVLPLTSLVLTIIPLILAAYYFAIAYERTVVNRRISPNISIINYAPFILITLTNFQYITTEMPIIFLSAGIHYLYAQFIQKTKSKLSLAINSSLLLLLDPDPTIFPIRILVIIIPYLPQLYLAWVTYRALRLISGVCIWPTLNHLTHTNAKARALRKVATLKAWLVARGIHHWHFLQLVVLTICLRGIVLALKSILIQWGATDYIISGLILSLAIILTYIQCLIIRKVLSRHYKKSIVSGLADALIFICGIGFLVENFFILVHSLDIFMLLGPNTSTPEHLPFLLNFGIKYIGLIILALATLAFYYLVYRAIKTVITKLFQILFFEDGGRSDQIRASFPILIILFCTFIASCVLSIVIFSNFTIIAPFIGVYNAILGVSSPGLTLALLLASAERYYQKSYIFRGRTERQELLKGIFFLAIYLCIAYPIYLGLVYLFSS